MTGQASGRDAAPRPQRRPRTAFLVLALVSLALLASALWIVVQEPRQSQNHRAPDFGEIRRLAAAGRFEEAIERVETALNADADNVFLRIMAAQLALDQPNPQPERALLHLGRVRSDDPAQAASAKLTAGKAHYALLRYEEAERDWLAALHLDPRVPEAAWALLDLYYLEGRSDEAVRLALKQHEVEPDPRDRVQLLLELVRQEAEPPEPGSLASRFEPVVRANPGDIHAVLARGAALVRVGQIENGLNMLADAAERWSDRAIAWDVLLTSIDATAQPGRLVETWARVPQRWRADERLARHAGIVAQARGDWPSAAAAFRRAWDARPHDLSAAYRLARALHAMKKGEQAAVCDRFLEGAQAARAELPSLYARANALKDLGLRPYASLYQRLADSREQLGRRDEARAWHNLVLRDRSDDPYSRNALERLESVQACPAPAETSAAPDGGGDDAVLPGP
jgi:tetratricopeptide (TPR) repeat protein